jgi:ribosomal protein S18 acetylase RimI-like enzyme
MEVSTRFAIEDDLQTLAIYERQIAIISFPDDPILDLQYHHDKLKRALRSDPDGMVVLTLEEDVVGWLWMRTKVSLATKERYGVLQSVYVREDLRCQGLAKSLVQYCIRYFEAKGIHRIVCKVHHENEAGKALLQRVGLQPVHLTYEYRTTLQPRPPELDEDVWEYTGGDDDVV